MQWEVLMITNTNEPSPNAIYTWVLSKQAIYIVHEQEQVLSKSLEHGSRTSDDQSIKVFLHKLEVHMKQLKVLQEQPTISWSSVCKQADWLGSVAHMFETRSLAGISCSSVYKQADWLGSVDQVFKITFTYIVDDTLKLPDQSCSRTAKNQLFSLFHTLFHISCTKEFSEQCLRTGFKSSLIRKTPHEEFKSVQGTALK